MYWHWVALQEKVDGEYLSKALLEAGPASIRHHPVGLHGLPKRDPARVSIAFLVADVAEQLEPDLIITYRYLSSRNRPTSFYKEFTYTLENISFHVYFISYKRVQLYSDQKLKYL